MPPKQVPSMTMTPPTGIFDGLTFFLAPCLSLTEQANLRKPLIDNGALECERIEEAEYVFTESDTFEDSKNARVGAIIVKPDWVKRSLMNKSRQPPQFFSASPFAIFSTLVFTCDHLPKGDVDALIAGTISRGGSYREALTKDTTHLLVLSPTGEKYKTARRYQASTGIKIVLVHWFDDCFKVEHRLPEGPYEKPLLDAEQQYLDADGNWIEPVGQAPQGRPAVSEKAKAFYDTLARAKTPTSSSPFPISLEPSPSKRPLSPTKRLSSPGRMSRFVDRQLSPSKGKGQAEPPKTKEASEGNNAPGHHNVWKGRRILISHSLALSNDRRRMVEREVERTGGIIVPNRAIPKSDDPAGSGYSGDELAPDSEEYKERDKQEAYILATANQPVDVYITKYRSGLAYLTAVLQASTKPMQAQVEDSEEEQMQTLPMTSGKRQSSPDMSIGSLAWLFFVHHSTAITPPTGQLLHYPVRRGPVSDFEGKQITVSNYTGQARDYLKKLIGVMGAEFTATMSQKTSVVIAGQMGGPKTERAQSWRIPIVNHFWLEETFVNWKLGNLSDPKYNRFNERTSYNEVLPGCPVGKAEDDGLNYEKEVSMVLKEMMSIGYEQEWAVAVKQGRLEKLLRESAEEAFDSDVAGQELSEDEDAMLSAFRRDARDAEGGPGSSGFAIENALLSDDVDVFDPIPETSSPHKQRQVDAMVSRMKGNSHPARRPSTSPQKELKAPVPVSSSDEGSSDQEEDEPEEPTRKNTISKRSSHAASPSKATRLPASRVSGATSAVPPPSFSHPVLRSPWEPSPTKNTSILDSKSKPTNPVPPPKAVVPTDDDSDESDNDLKNMRDITYARLTQSNKASSSPSKGIKGTKDRPSSPPQSTSTTKASRKEKDSNPAKKAGAVKSPKRIIRTQESDEEFQIESQGDLSARRRKILNANTNAGGVAARKLSLDVMDVDSDSDVQLAKALQISTKVGPPKSKNKGKGKGRLSKGEQAREDGSGDEMKERRLSSNAKAAMKKLRDSISGKEDLKAPNADTSKPKTNRSKQANAAEQPRSRTRTRQADTDDEQDHDSDNDDNGDEDNQYMPTRRPISVSSEPSSDKPGPPTETEEDSHAPRPSKSKAKASTTDRVASKKAAARAETPEVPIRARRGAAERASELLHNKIMPDANRFAEQIKRGDVRGDWEDTNARRREWEQKKTKRPRAEDTDGTVDDREDGRRKRRKSDDEGSVALDRRKTERVESIPNPGIRILTTKLPLTDEEISQMRQLGIRKVEDPLQCTHLVTNSILRTEKFLCAMSVAPKIVEERWLRECLREGEVIHDVSDYLLYDQEREEKYGMDLAASLERAEENGPTLFAGHTFYLAPGIPQAAVATLMNAIKSAGGTCQRTIPQARILEGHEETKHVIGTEADRDKWQPLVNKGIPVYSQEVVLLSILRQELPDWESDEWKLAASL